jgi:AraC family transcriptional regulator
MVLNVKRVDVATVPIDVPRHTDYRFAVRALVSSQLLAADLNFGREPVEADAAFPAWEDAYTIGVRLNDEQADIFVDGRAYTSPNRRGEMHILYLSGVEHINLSTPRHTIEILLRRAFMAQIADDLEVPCVTYLGRSLFQVADDPVLRRLALRICPYFDAPRTLDPLQADHFMWSLGIYLCAHYGDLTLKRPLAGGLSTWQERLAKDVIETYLVDGIGLADLAALCGLRASQFSHAFKRSTGVAPYQWLLRRRIARARDQLSNSDAPLADIALASGFADQSHMTRSFVRHYGVTPGAWRAACN